MFLIGIYKDIFMLTISNKLSYQFDKILQSTEDFGLSHKLFSKIGISFEVWFNCTCLVN
jgi:hypothetical protein